MYILLSLSMHTMSVDRGVKDRATLIKSKDGECNTSKRERKAIINHPSLQTRLSVLFPLFCLFSLSLSLRHVYILLRRKQTETIKPSVLEKWLLCASPAPDPPVRLLWKHAIRGRAFASEWNESQRKSVDPGQSEAARGTEGQFREPITWRDQEDRS